MRKPTVGCEHRSATESCEPLVLPLAKPIAQQHLAVDFEHRFGGTGGWLIRDDDRVSDACAVPDDRPRDGNRVGGAFEGPGTGPPWMCADEYRASLRDIPDEVLDSAPVGMPEGLWLAAMAARLRSAG